MSESNALCPSCSDENVKAFADIPLTDPETGTFCAESFSTECVRYDGINYLTLGISKGMTLTDLIVILAQDDGAAPLTSVNHEDSDHISMTGDGKIATPLQATLNLTPALMDELLDLMITLPATQATLNGYIEDVISGVPAVVPVGCIVTGQAFTRIFNNPDYWSASGTYYGVQDSDTSAQYELSIWDQTLGLAHGYVSAGISMTRADQEISRFTQRGTPIKWRFRKYCGLDGSGIQIFSDWVQGPDITIF